MITGMGFAEDAIDITRNCKFRSNNSSDNYKLKDGKIKSAWTSGHSESEVMVMVPDEGASAIEIYWKVIAREFTMTEYDAQQNTIRETIAGDDGGYYLTQGYRLQKNTKYIKITYSQSNQGICEIRLYRGDHMPARVNHWKPQNEKCDLMVISTHQDDEWLWFGGIIPYYDLVKGKNVQVMYMANCGRSRYQEALNGLSVAGIRTMPVFLDLKDEKLSSLSRTYAGWGGQERLIGLLVEQIRKYKPEVILTHDWDGEYGHKQHIATSRSMEQAIEAAADETRFPESAETYGAWQVKKLYRHLEKKQPIQFDWHIPYEELKGRTCLQTADDAMNQHASQLKWYHVEDHGQYDNSLFGLSYTVVGDDVRHDDLFENIDE